MPSSNHFFNSSQLLRLGIIALFPIVVSFNHVGFRNKSTIAGARPRVQTSKVKASVETVNYSLKVIAQGDVPRIEVTMSFPIDAGEEAVKVQMPAWSPGDYHLQNHGKYVLEFHPVGINGEEERPDLSFKRVDEATWEIETNGAERVSITYVVPQTPPGFFSQNVKIERTQGFINGASAFLYLVEHKDWKTKLDISLPNSWKAETPLPPAPLKEGVSNSYFAADYDTLADSPIAMGDAESLKIREFEASGVKHKAVFFGKTSSLKNPDLYSPVLKKIVESETKIMGGTPYAQYDFFFDVDGDGGGLEHLNSCRIALYSQASPKSFASFFGHEFFHLWNVKRIRPAVLGPFDYIKPPRTRNLWFAEGVTEYYAHIAAYRAGISTEDEFLKHWKQAINRMKLNPARKKVTADEASLKVWESGNSQGYGGLSYYDKGELIGLCLDLKIRSVTENRKSLDDVMRLLMLRHNPPKPGYGEDELRLVVTEVAGVDLSSLYDKLARSTQEMPFEESLGYAGFTGDLALAPNSSAAQLAVRKGWMEGVTKTAGEK